MKKYLITFKLMEKLIYGENTEKEIISSNLENLLQNNNSMFISFNSLNLILKKEKDLEIQKLILENINMICEKIIPIENSYLPLAIGAEIQYETDYSTALEFISAQVNEMDFILDISQDFKFQNIISVAEIILKIK